MRDYWQLNVALFLQQNYHAFYKLNRPNYLNYHVRTQACHFSTSYTQWTI